MHTARSSPWFLGIDIGTGSCKSLVVDEHARPLGLGASDYTSKSSQTRWKEQDPAAVFAGMLSAVRKSIYEAGVQPAACAGASLSTPLHTLLAVDKTGKPLSGVITWADDRAAWQAHAARESSLFRPLYRKTGCPIHWLFPLYKILWMKQNTPAEFQRAARFITLKEYILQRLTGEYAVDYCLAAGSGLLNTFSLDWEDSILALAGVSRDQLTPPGDPLERLPGIRPRWAERLGLTSKTPLYLGSSDATNSSLGVGAPHPWQATCMVGTSAALRLISDQPVLDPQSRSWCYAIDRGHWLVGGAINNGGLAVAWLRDMLNSAMPKGASSDELSFEELISLGADVEPGAGGLLCLPFFAGERSPGWNLDARGAFFGLTLQHDLHHLARALLEGIAFRLRSLADVLSEVASPVTEIRGSGGFTQSPLWVQIVSSVLKRELAITEVGEASSLGAAFWAMRVAGVIPSFDVLEKLVPVVRVYAPQAGPSQVYDRLYPLYQQLYQATHPFFTALAAVDRAVNSGDTQEPSI